MSAIRRHATRTRTAMRLAKPYARRQRIPFHARLMCANLAARQTYIRPRLRRPKARLSESLSSPEPRKKKKTTMYSLQWRQRGRRTRKSNGGSSILVRRWVSKYGHPSETEVEHGTVAV